MVHLIGSDGMELNPKPTPQAKSLYQVQRRVAELEVAVMKTQRALEKHQKILTEIVEAIKEAKGE